MPDWAFDASPAPPPPGERLNLDFLGMRPSPDGLERSSFHDWDLHLGLQLLATAGTDQAAQRRALAIEFACRQVLMADPLCDGLLATPLEYGEIEALMLEQTQSLTCLIGVHLTVPWIRLPKPELVETGA